MPSSEVTRDDIIRMMVGREITQMFPKEEVPIGDVVLSVRAIQSNEARHNTTIDFSITASSRIFANSARRLRKKGAVFETETDTEIVLHLVDYLARPGRRSGGSGESGALAASRRIRARLSSSPATMI